MAVSASAKWTRVILFMLPEQSLTKLQEYQNPEKNFTVLAVSRDNTNLLDKGTLAVIDNQIDTTTGTIKLKANFANENLRLWPGQFVNTRLLLATRRTARWFRRRWSNADRTAR